MKTKTYPYDDFALDNPAEALARSFRALYRRRVVSLESVSMSVRWRGRVTYLDAASAANVLLGLVSTTQWPEEVAHAGRTAVPAALHARAYSRYEDVHAVITGSPPAAMALLELGLPLGRPTSMMRKRNVHDPGAHVFPYASLDAVDAMLSQARATTDAADMGHMLMIVPDWGVVCAAANLAEAVAHFDNVEVVARAEVARLTSRGGIS